MSYKWKPSKSQKREFAQNMQNSQFANEYYKRKAEKADRRRSKSKFDYESAGGNYVPTKTQAGEAYNFLITKTMTSEEIEACQMVFSAYGLNEKCDHDYIHIVNELIRKK
jgi:hypothetical protein